MRVGALAFWHDKHRFIGFNAGTEFILYLVFNRIFADSSLFPGVGDATVESGTLDKLTNFSLDAQAMVDQDFKVHYPTDPIRRDYAGHLVNMVACYVSQHEDEHWSQGHMDAPLPRDPITDQTVEMAADKMAISYSLGNVMHMCATYGPETRPKTFFDSRRNAIKWWFFGLCVFTRLWGDHRLAGVRLDIDGHPPWRMRIFMMAEAAMELIITKGESRFGTVADAMGAFGEAMTEAERAYCHITGEQPAHEGINDSSHPDVIRHKRRLRDYWRKTIRPTLERFKWGALPP